MCVIVEGKVDHADDVTRARLGAGAACFASTSVQAHVWRLVALAALRRDDLGITQSSFERSSAADEGVPGGGRVYDDHRGGRKALFGEKRRPPDTSAM